MQELAVIHSERDGLWHLCYYRQIEDKFYSFQSFVSKDLAEATAWKMNRDRQKGKQ